MESSKNVCSSSKRIMILCDQHPNREIEFKCINDFTFLCSTCLLLTHEKTHQIEKLEPIEDFVLIEEKLEQLHFRANSYLQKIKLIKNSSSSFKSNEILDLFKSSINILKSPFCMTLRKEREGKDKFPLDFSSFFDFKKISKIAESLNKYEIKFIEELFFPKKIEKLDLLFRASQNCFSAQRFHNFCDFKGPTLTLIKAKTGKVFGGFCSISWVVDEKGSYYSAPDTFIFSVTGLKKFELKNNYDDEAIYNCNVYGPTFGNGYDIYISDSCNSKNDSYSNLGSTFEIPKCLFEAKSSEARAFLASSYKFKVEEYEVFSIKFII